MLILKNIIYTKLYSLKWLFIYYFGPYETHWHHAPQYIPKKKVFLKGTPLKSIVFVGDFLGIGNKNLIIGNELHDFIKTADFFVGNFEGVIKKSNIPIAYKQHSTIKLLNKLNEYIPLNKTVFSLANNHTYDFEIQGFKDTVKILEEHGCHVFGLFDKPSINLSDNIQVTGFTTRFNNKNTTIKSFDNSINSYNTSLFNILYPHWGDEFELYPSLEQIEWVKKILSGWDAVIGHHPHVPQPVSLYKTDSKNKIAAYSIGNFTVSKNYKFLSFGIVLKLNIGKSENNCLEILSTEWEFIKILVKKDDVNVNIIEDCDIN